MNRWYLLKFVNCTTIDAKWVYRQFLRIILILSNFMRMHFSWIPRPRLSLEDNCFDVGGIWNPSVTLSTFFVVITFEISCLLVTCLWTNHLELSCAHVLLKVPLLRSLLISITLELLMCIRCFLAQECVPSSCDAYGSAPCLIVTLPTFHCLALLLAHVLLRNVLLVDSPSHNHCWSVSSLLPINFQFWCTILR